MMFIFSIIVVGLYFFWKRVFVIGIVMSGFGVGIFVYVYFCEVFLNEFSWWGIVLIMVGIILNCVVCVVLFRFLLNEVVK